MDVHKERIVLAILDGEETEAETVTIRNTPQALRKLLRRLSPDGGAVHACYEAGPCGYDVQRQLTTLGIDCAEIAPSLIPAKAGDRVKTDRRDATKLASLHRAGLLTPIAVPDEEQEALRDLVRARESVMRQVRAARHQLAKFLLRRGRIYREGRNWTQRHRAWVRAQTFEHPAAQKTCDHYRLHLEYLEQRLAELDGDLAAVGQDEPYREVVGRLSCLRGVNLLTAMILVAEIWDFRRFPSAAAFSSYLGLVPSEHSSGSSERRGAITKAGNVHVRRALVEAAWHYRHPPSLDGAVGRRVQGQDPAVVQQAFHAQRRLHRTYWKMVNRGRPSSVAAVAVARELSGFLWGLMTAA
jgi:transposase